MRANLREGISAGALGLSTTRMLAHRSIRGEAVPGTFAEEHELAALAGVLQELGTGVFEVVPRGMDGEVSEEAHAEIDWMARIEEQIRRPVVFSLIQIHTEVDRWRVFLERAGELQARGVPLYPEVAARPTGIQFGLQSVFTPCSTRPSYKALEPLLPEMVWDLPTGARRIMQRARGYVAPFPGD